jgi:hypothetical protein
MKRIGNAKVRVPVPSYELVKEYLLSNNITPSTENIEYVLALYYKLVPDPATLLASRWTDDQ